MTNQKLLSMKDTPTKKVMPNKVFLFAILMMTAVSLFAQTASAPEAGRAAGVSLSAEIQNMEAVIARQSVPPAERHQALVRLARLHQLSGNIESAARRWLEAAAAIPGSVDDDALMSCAICLAAMGEWDRAAAALEPLVSKNQRARFLDFGIKAVKTGDTFSLALIVDNPEFSAMKHEILFLLWKITQRTENREQSERWRRQLVSEFPQSPEGRLANNREQIAVMPSPFWFFVNGLDSLPLLASEPRVGSREQGAAAVQAASAGQQSTVVQSVQPASVSAAQQPSAVQSSSGQAASVGRLQTGVFSRESNAQAQINALRRAGFSPSVERRGEMWAVVVPAGEDSSRTASDLRTAGFESFFVR